MRAQGGKECRGARAQRHGNIGAWGLGACDRVGTGAAQGPGVAEGHNSEALGHGGHRGACGPLPSFVRSGAGGDAAVGAAPGRLPAGAAQAQARGGGPEGARGLHRRGAGPGAAGGAPDPVPNGDP